MDMQAKAKQVEFAALVGATQQAIAKHVEAGVLPRGATYEQWLVAYCDRLRTEASGRVKSEARERRDVAQAMESEINAEMKRRQLFKEDGLLLDIDSVRQVLTEWATIGKNEFLGAVDKIVTAIEAEHGITIDRDQLQFDIDTALKAIGSYAFEPGALGDGGAGAMDAAA